MQEKNKNLTQENPTFQNLDSQSLMQAQSLLAAQDERGIKPPSVLQMQDAAFPIVGALIFALIHLYIYKALFKSFSTKPLWRNAWRALIAINLIGALTYFHYLHAAPPSQSVFLFLSISIGVAFCFFVLTIIYQIFSLGILCIKDKHKRGKARFWLKRGVGIFGLIFIVFGIFNGTQKPKITEIQLQIPNLSREISAVQLSDIHIGGLVERTRVADIVERTNALKPDVIFLTGDIVDANSEQVADAISELGGLKARFGVFYVLGNHEYFHDVHNILNRMYELDFRVLINEASVVFLDSPNYENSSFYALENREKIIIAGIADLVGMRPKFQEFDLRPNLRFTLEEAQLLNAPISQDIVEFRQKMADSENLNSQNSSPIILLSHQPKVLEEIQEIAQGDEKYLLKNLRLILSGHTHGGQIWPFSYAVLLQQPYIKGLFEIEFLKDVFLYINQGTGSWGPPMRVGSESEITLLRLKPKE